MIKTNINTQCSGMVMQCIVDHQKEEGTLPIVIELGCADGQGVSRYQGFCEKVICVDAMEYGRLDVFSYVKEPLKVDDKKLSEFEKNTDMSGSDIRLIIGSTSWDETFESVKACLEGKSADILLIDAAHHPQECVQKDFDMYAPLVRKKGFVIFDDTYEKDVRLVMEAALESSDYCVHDEFYVFTDKVILQKMHALRKLS